MKYEFEITYRLQLSVLLEEFCSCLYAGNGYRFSKCSLDILDRALLNGDCVTRILSVEEVETSLDWRKELALLLVVLPSSLNER